jgi:hypothetical protein
MYTGNLIDELFATVVRVEVSAESRVKEAGEPAELERWYMTVHQSNARRTEQNLLGVGA